LVPTREVINLAVAFIAPDTAAKLLGVNPFGELRKNQFSSGYDASLAAQLLRKTTKLNLNRSHHFSCACASLWLAYNRQHSPRRDGSDAIRISRTSWFARPVMNFGMKIPIYRRKIKFK
jgi:hypothetical protein